MEDVHCCSPSHSWPLIEALHRQNRWPQLGPRAVLPLAVAVGPVQARCAVRDILMPGSGPRADGAGLIGCIPHFPAAASIPTSVALGQVSSTLPGLACGQHQQDPGWHCRKLGPCQAHTPALGGHFGCVRRTAGRSCCAGGQQCTWGLGCARSCPPWWASLPFQTACQPGRHTERPRLVGAERRLLS